MAKKFKSLSEVYETGETYKREEPVDEYSTYRLSEAYKLVQEAPVYIGDTYVGEIDPTRENELKDLLVSKDFHSKMFETLEHLKGTVKELVRVSGFLKTTKTGEQFQESLLGAFRRHPDLLRDYEAIINAIISHRKNIAPAAQIRPKIETGELNLKRDFELILHHQLSLQDKEIQSHIFDELFRLMIQAKPAEMPAVGQGEFLMSCIYDVHQFTGKAEADLQTDDQQLSIEVKGKEARPGSSGADYALKRTMKELENIVVDGFSLTNTNITRSWDKAKSISVRIAKMANGGLSIAQQQMISDVNVSEILRDAMPPKQDDDIFNKVNMEAVHELENISDRFISQAGKGREFHNLLSELIKILTGISSNIPVLDEKDLIKDFHNKAWGDGVKTFLGHAIRNLHNQPDNYQDNWKKLVDGVYHMRNHEDDPDDVLRSQLTELLGNHEWSSLSGILMSNIDVFIGALHITSYAHNHNFDYIVFVDEHPNSPGYGKACPIKTTGKTTRLEDVFDQMMEKDWKISLNIDKSSQGSTGVQITYKGK